MILLVLLELIDMTWKKYDAFQFKILGFRLVSVSAESYDYILSFCFGIWPKPKRWFRSYALNVVILNVVNLNLSLSLCLICSLSLIILIFFYISVSTVQIPFPNCWSLWTPCKFMLQKCPSNQTSFERHWFFDSSTK